MTQVINIVAEDIEQVNVEAEHAQKPPAPKHRSYVRKIPAASVKETTRALGPDLDSPMATSGASGNLAPITPRDGLRQAQTYLMAT